MKNEFELKPFDKVLVRDKETAAWQIDLYEKCEKFSFESLLLLPRVVMGILYTIRRQRTFARNN